MRKKCWLNVESPVFWVGLGLLGLMGLAWGAAIVMGESCTFCLWQRGVWTLVGTLVFGLSCVRKGWQVKLIKVCVIACCLAISLIAYQHLDLLFKGQVMGIVQVLNAYQTAAPHEGESLKALLSQELQLHWVLSALSFWSGLCAVSVGAWCVGACQKGEKR